MTWPACGSVAGRGASGAGLRCGGAFLAVDFLVARVDFAAGFLAGIGMLGMVIPGVIA